MGLVFLVGGLLVGSFLNVVVLRLPSGGTLSGRSMCPSCGETLGPLDLVPLLSYLWLKGRCRYCTTRIHYRYPLIEALSAGLFFLGYMVFVQGNLSPDYFRLAIVLLSSCIALVVFVIDLEHYLILDKVVFAGLALLVVFFCLQGLIGETWEGLFTSVLGLLVGTAPLFLLWYISHGKWMGFGDVKYMLYIGLATGFPLVIMAFLLTFWLGSLVAVPLLLAGKKKFSSKLPLGTFMSVSLLVTLYFGEYVASWVAVLLM